MHSICKFLLLYACCTYVSWRCLGENHASPTGGFIETALPRFSLLFDPQIRSTYLSLGQIVEDRPMQVTNLRLKYDLGAFGKIGIRNWDVSSLSDRRDDVHRHALYHTEVGPTWEYDFDFTDDWRLHNDITVSWTFYDGFDNPTSNKTYRWWQLDQSLVNPYLTPFWRIRRCVTGSDYLYCRVGVRRKFTLWHGLYLAPELALDGGNARNQNRVFGKRADGSQIGNGFYSISPRLELGYSFNANFTLYAWIEQYEVMGSARSVNADSTRRCAHNDWTHGGIGLRYSF